MHRSAAGFGTHCCLSWHSDGTELGFSRPSTKHRPTDIQTSSEADSKRVRSRLQHMPVSFFTSTSVRFDYSSTAVRGFFDLASRLLRDSFDPASGRLRLCFDSASGLFVLQSVAFRSHSRDPRSSVGGVPALGRTHVGRFQNGSRSTKGRTHTPNLFKVQLINVIFVLLTNAIRYDDDYGYCNEGKWHKVA